MSWLSKALKNNSVKIGLVLAGATIGKEYFYGDYSSDSYLPTGELVKGSYTSGNVASEILNAFEVTPFKDTAAGESFLGTALDYMEPVKDKGLDSRSQGSSRQHGSPSSPCHEMTAGSQSFRDAGWL